MGNIFRKVWLLIIFLIAFKVAFNKNVLISSGNLVTSEKLMGYKMKCDSSEPDYNKVGNELFN